jgi:mono/diheme cytochrome c family protein
VHQNGERLGHEGSGVPPGTVRGPGPLDPRCGEGTKLSPRGWMGERPLVSSVPVLSMARAKSRVVLAFGAFMSAALLVGLAGCQGRGSLEGPLPSSPTPPAVSTPQPSIGEDPAVARGRQLYFNQGCNVCHGDQGEGGLGPPLAGTCLSYDEVRRQLREPRGFMPAYIEEALSDNQVRDLYAFEQSLPPP